MTVGNVQGGESRRWRPWLDAEPMISGLRRSFLLEASEGPLASARAMTASADFSNGSPREVRWVLPPSSVSGVGIRLYFFNLYG